MNTSATGPRWREPARCSVWDLMKKLHTANRQIESYTERREAIVEELGTRREQMEWRIGSLQKALKTIDEQMAAAKSRMAQHPKTKAAHIK